MKTIEKITVWKDNLKKQLKDIKDHKCNLGASQLVQNMRANEKYQENKKGGLLNIPEQLAEVKSV